MRPPQTTTTVTLSVDPIACTYADPNEPMRYALAGELTARLLEAAARRQHATDPVAKAIRRRIAKNEKTLAVMAKERAASMREMARRDTAHEAWRRETMKPRKGKAKPLRGAL